MGDAEEKKEGEEEDSGPSLKQVSALLACAIPAAYVNLLFEVRLRCKKSFSWKCSKFPLHLTIYHLNFMTKVKTTLILGNIRHKTV